MDWTGEAFRGASAPLTTGSKQVKNRVNDGTVGRPAFWQYGGRQLSYASAFGIF